MVGEEYDYDDTEYAVEEEFANEDSLSKQEDASFDGYTPELQGKDDLWSLFWKVVKSDESSKVGNLDKVELGLLPISVRDCPRIALIANTLGHPGFANFFRNQAEIILATSCSKDGFLNELFVSQKKFSTKTRGLPDIPKGINTQPRKKGLFVKKE